MKRRIGILKRSKLADMVIGLTTILIGRFHEIDIGALRFQFGNVLMAINIALLH
jgi:hypothetical protein